MSTKLKAGTATSGAVLDADTTGILELQSGSTPTTAVTIDGSQNVGIGTASPTNKLDVRSSQPTINAQATTNGNAGLLQLTALSGDGSNTCAVQVIGASIANSSASNMIFKNDGGSGLTERMRIKSTGDIKIVSGNLLGWSDFSAGSTGVGVVGSGENLLFYSSGTERMRIDSSGNLLVGKTASSTSNVGVQFNPNGQSIFSMASGLSAADTLNVYSTTSGVFRFYVDMSGKVWATSTTIAAISDQRLKENVRDLDIGLDAIMTVQPRRFDWKDGKGQDKKNAVGFIAQEFETVFPDSVAPSKAGEDGIEYKTVCHEELIPTMVKAIQELKAQVDAQAAEIATLKGNA